MADPVPPVTPPTSPLSPTNSYTNYSSYSTPNGSYDVPPEGSKTLSIVAMVFGIIGGVAVLSCCCCVWGFAVPILTGIVATICGIIALVKKNAGRGMAISGVILGVISFLCGIACLILLSTVFNMDTDELVQWYADLEGISYEEALDELGREGIIVEEESNHFSYYEETPDFETNILGEM